MRHHLGVVIQAPFAQLRVSVVTLPGRAIPAQLSDVEWIVHNPGPTRAVAVDGRAHPPFGPLRVQSVGGAIPGGARRWHPPSSFNFAAIHRGDLPSAYQL